MAGRNVIIRGDELFHWGIKGQKWGVRRYQNEDGTLTEEGKRRYGVIKKEGSNEYTRYADPNVVLKGQRLNSVSFDRSGRNYLARVKKLKAPLYLYDPNNDWDKTVYTGPFAKYKLMYDTTFRLTGKSFLNEHSFETTKELTVADRKARVDAFIELYNSKYKKVLVDDLTRVKDILDNTYRFNYATPEPKHFDLKNLGKDHQSIERAYEIFNHEMEAAHRFASAKKYINLISKRYDAMIDDNNLGVYNRAQAPLVVFKADKVLKEIGESRLIDVKEVTANYNKIADYLWEKYGERTKL